MRPPVKTAAEQDTVTRWRHYLCYLTKPGVTAGIKRQIRRRKRRDARRDMRKEGA